MTDASETEAERLERLWAGEFGDSYVDRNRAAYARRRDFWQDMTRRLAPDRVLEVGCNAGGNLRWLTPPLAARDVYGVDVNEHALAVAREIIPGVNVLSGTARDLPFRDGWFDVVFTMGVLIHQPEDSVRDVVAEMIRTSRTWLLCGEYADDQTVEIAYRGHDGALFRRDYRALFLDTEPRLEVVDEGRLTERDGFDDVTWHLFRKP